MNPNKIKLEQVKDHDKRSKSIRYALPYFKSNQASARYVHRLRSAQQHNIGKYGMHISLHFWCGNHGFMKKGRMFASVPEGEVLCATCEGRAIGAGIDGPRRINGRDVMYDAAGEDFATDPKEGIAHDE